MRLFYSRPLGNDRQVLEREISVIKELLDIEPDSKCEFPSFPLVILRLLTVVVHRVHGIDCTLSTFPPTESRPGPKTFGQRMSGNVKAVGEGRSAKKGEV
jgi:hypothetical protein